MSGIVEVETETSCRPAASPLTGVTAESAAAASDVCVAAGFGELCSEQGLSAPVAEREKNILRGFVD